MWIYAVLLMSVGPVGPGGGVYSIVEVVVYKVYLKTLPKALRTQVLTALTSNLVW